jgi:hypothetical protein
VLEEVVGDALNENIRQGDRNGLLGKVKRRKRFALAAGGSPNPGRELIRLCYQAPPGTISPPEAARLFPAAPETGACYWRGKNGQLAFRDA